MMCSFENANAYLSSSTPQKSIQYVPFTKTDSVCTNAEWTSRYLLFKPGPSSSSACRAGAVSGVPRVQPAAMIGYLSPASGLSVSFRICLYPACPLRVLIVRRCVSFLLTVLVRLVAWYHCSTEEGRGRDNER